MTCRFEKRPCLCPAQPTQSTARALYCERRDSPSRRRPFFAPAPGGHRLRSFDFTRGWPKDGRRSSSWRRGTCPPAALALPAVAHVLTRCNIPGADNSLDYVYAPNGAKLISAFPKLGWIDATSVAPGLKAAPALAIQGVTCCAAFGDWDGAALRPLLALSELTTSFTLAYMSRAADALEAGQGTWCSEGGLASLPARGST